MKNYIINLLLVLIYSNDSNSQSIQKDSVLYYNNMQKKLVISNKTMYSYYNKRGKLLLKYDYSRDQIISDSIDRSQMFYLYQTDTMEMKKNYDIPPSLIFSDCLQGSMINFEYPYEATVKNIQGEMKIDILIDRFGNVKDYQKVKSLGYGVEEACIKKFKTYTKCWFPAIKNGRTVDSKAQFTINFIMTTDY